MLTREARGVYNKRGVVRHIKKRFAHRRETLDPFAGRVFVQELNLLKYADLKEGWQSMKRE